MDRCPPPPGRSGALGVKERAEQGAHSLREVRMVLPDQLLRRGDGGPRRWHQHAAALAYHPGYVAAPQNVGAELCLAKQAPPAQANFGKK